MSIGISGSAAAAVGSTGAPHAERLYTLQAGEGLATVAQRLGVPTLELLAANPQIRYPELVGPGDTLRLPAGASADDLAAGAVREDLEFGTMGQSTTTLPPVIVTPPPQPDPFPGPPDPVPDPWDPGPGDGGDVGGGSGPGDPAPTQATSLDQLAELLGPDVMDIINQSPLLQQKLQQLFDQGWVVRIGAVAEARLATQELILTAGNPQQVIATMAHEIGHALHGNAFDWSSRDAFIESGLTTEAEAALFQMQVRDELAAQGIHIPMLTADAATTNALYQQVWANFQADGNRDAAIAALVDIYRNHESSASGQSYPDFYGNHYDQHHTPPPPPPGGGGPGGGGPGGPGGPGDGDGPPQQVP